MTNNTILQFQNNNLAITPSSSITTSTESSLKILDQEPAINHTSTDPVTVEIIPRIISPTEFILPEIVEFHPPPLSRTEIKQTVAEYMDINVSILF